MARTLVEFLRGMPHVASDALLIRAVEALGLRVSPCASEHRVMFGDSTIAVIRDSRMELREMVLEQIAHQFPAVSRAQGETFNRVLKEINPDKIPVHEAGHAVAAHLFGFTIRYAQVGEIDEVELMPHGFVQECYDSGDLQLIQAVQEFLAAGVAAEQLIFNAKPTYGFCSDCHTIVKFERKRRKHPDLEEEEFEDLDSTQSGDKVFWHFVSEVQPKLPVRMVEAVATTLKQRGRVTGKSLKKLLQGIERESSFE